MSKPDSGDGHKSHGVPTVEGMEGIAVAVDVGR